MQVSLYAHFTRVECNTINAHLRSSVLSLLDLLEFLSINHLIHRFHSEALLGTRYHGFRPADKAWQNMIILCGSLLTSGKARINEEISQHC